MFFCKRHSYFISFLFLNQYSDRIPAASWKIDLIENGKTLKNVNLEASLSKEIKTSLHLIYLSKRKINAIFIALVAGLVKWLVSQKESACSGIDTGMVTYIYY